MSVGRLRRDRRSARGATAVEFALVVLPLLYLVFGILQYGLYFYAKQSATFAVQQAVRRLSVGDCTDATGLKAYLYNRLGAANTTAQASLSPTTTYYKSDGTTVVLQTDAQNGYQVTLSLTNGTINLHFPFLPLPNGGQVATTSQAMIESSAATNSCPA